jgi:predicted Zn-dependent protease
MSGRTLRPGIAAILIISSVGLLFAAALTVGCASVAKIGTSIAQGEGLIDSTQSQSINRVAKAADKSFEDIDPEQEYYIGRAVAATILNTYPPADDEALNRYVNLLGQTIAFASDRPETFGGYHFLVLGTDEINAFAAPGGFILVSRGLIRCCRSEDELAAVLAHEVGHVVNKDGLRAIKKSRLTSALTTIATEGAANLGSEKLAKLTEEFSGSITDITSTLMNSGYSRSLEKQADASAVADLRRVGYSPQALVTMLGEMKKRLTPGGPGFARTHPDPSDRIADIQGSVSGSPAPPDPETRRNRFAAAVAGL